MGVIWHFKGTAVSTWRTRCKVRNKKRRDHWCACTSSCVSYCRNTLLVSQTCLLAGISKVQIIMNSLRSIILSILCFFVSHFLLSIRECSILIVTLPISLSRGLLLFFCPLWIFSRHKRQDYAVFFQAELV